MNYWSRKDELRVKAQKHTEEMQDAYDAEIQSAVRDSIIYGEGARYPEKKNSDSAPIFYFLNTDSVTALLMSQEESAAVLNFASYKNPGGKFIEGSSAQEESLCHASFLYNVLREFPGYYEWNAKHKNRALYENRAIYTPNVLFEKDGKSRFCDVITCAAPNKGAAQKYNRVSDDENRHELFERVVFVKDIAEENNIKTLILGAFGCGVFRQNAEDVCEAIRTAFAKSTVKNIVVAVPGNDHNAKIFRMSFL